MLRELRTFIAVAQHGTFSRAAARIGLTQSAVSAQMQRLESELGIALFDRTGRSAVLSQAGRETLALAGEMMTLYARLGRHGTTPEDHGMLRIGAIASAQWSFLVDTITDFRQAHPGWRIRVVPGLSLHLLAQVDAGELDAAVIIRPPFALPAELEWTSLVDEPFMLLVPDALAAAPWRDTLVSAPFVRYDRGSFGGRLVDRFLRRARLAVHDVVELDELPAIARLVARGVGVALVPRAATLDAWPAGVRALDLGEDGFHREIGLVQPRQDRQPVTRRFAALAALAAQAARPPGGACAMG
ncbi:LysR family transcriptional regulator [Robbsia sp. Bb-Pol-6]|uniref:LysR family transcriptional regulator n=1 Tax=Robbsia betulipollinis TaxID=2981849 RepID=A0ABT3ZKN8_9BURK|nr:LysR family transcriptional regulator [Robbsia betulipollinis]MCY0387100.1 LysR family transcriptional regulator [Robbsia betulipollinis]